MTESSELSVRRSAENSATVRTLAGLLLLRRLSVISGSTVFRSGLSRTVFLSRAVSIALPCGINGGLHYAECSGCEEYAQATWHQLRKEGLDYGAFLTTNVVSPSAVRIRR